MLQTTPSRLDAARTALRRRAITEDWPATMLAVAEDLADTARDDGTHALRTREQQAARLGVSEATIKRHRVELQRLGVLVVRRKGGRGRGATVLDLVTDHGLLTSTTVTSDHVTPVQPDSGSQVRGDVTLDQPDSGSITGQSRVTVERERDPRPLSPSPKQASGPETAGTKSSKSSDLADTLASATGWPPAHCSKVLTDKRADLIARGYVKAPDAILRRIVTENPTELPAPAATMGPRVTLDQCASSDLHGPHEWVARGRDRCYCHGVEEWNGDPYAPVTRRHQAATA